MRARVRVTLTLMAAAVLVLAACSRAGHPSGTDVVPTTATVGTSPAVTTVPPRAHPTVSPGAPERRPVTIAFAGDVHFASFLAARLAHPRTEHFAPLFVTLGATENLDGQRTVIDGFWHGLAKRSLQFD